MSAAKAELRGWHVLAAILSFFGVVIGVNATFIALAVQSFPGEDVRRSYLQGVHYNEILADRRAQAALGWRAEAALMGGADGAVVEIVLHARDGAVIEGATIEGALQWPAAARLDHALTFEAMGQGRYVARVGVLPTGHWRLRARAERGDGALDFQSELTWASR